MAKETKEIKKPESTEDRKETVTAFLLMFPALIVGFIAMMTGTHVLRDNIVVVALLILQFVMLEQFVKDFYKTRF